MFKKLFLLTDHDWKIIVYLISGSSGLIILILAGCLCKQCMKKRRWTIRRQRTKEMQTPHERFVLREGEASV